MQEYKPYTYLIGWSKLNKWYYGCQYANNKRNIANPKNLWKTYFTSSVCVKQFREEHGEPDVIEVRKIFYNSKKCLLWEHKILQKNESCCQ